MLIFALSSGILRSAESSTAPALNVMSFNVRFNNPQDGINAWPHRKTLAAAVIRENHADFVGLQEALHGQLTDLRELLPAYDWVGVGRDDGKEQGEYSAIFYNREKFAAVKTGTSWLSETPETPGQVGWDAACPRIVTWGVFEERSSWRRFLFVNTHLDHKGATARLESAKLIASHITKWRGDLPVILTGDFNDDERSAPVQLLSNDSELGLRLAKSHFSADQIGGNTTFNNFKPIETGLVIDFIFVSAGIQVESYKYLRESSGDVLVSDHWPVFCRLRLPQ